MILSGNNLDILAQAESTLLGSLTGTLYRAKSVSFSAKPVFQDVRRTAMNRQAFSAARLMTEYEVSFTKELRISALDQLFLSSILNLASGTLGFRHTESIPSLSMWVKATTGILYQLKGLVVERIALSVRPREVLTIQINARAAACIVAPTSPGTPTDEPYGSITHLNAVVTTPESNLTDFNLVFTSTKNFLRNPTPYACFEQPVRVTGSYSNYMTGINSDTLLGMVNPETIGVTYTKGTRSLAFTTTGIVWAEEPSQPSGADCIRQVNFEPQTWSGTIAVS